MRATIPRRTVRGETFFFPSQDNDIVSLMMKRVYDIAASTSNRIKAATASMDWFVGENLTRKPEIFP